jgi:hypothetical protein
MHSSLSTTSDLDAYTETCRATFAGRPEAHRIALYTTMADRDPDTSLHLYRLAGACLDGGAVELWTRGVRLAFERPHESRRTLFERREARIRLGEFTGWQDLACWENDPEFGRGNATCPPEGYAWWDGTEDLSAKSVRITLMGGLGDAIWWLRFIEPLHACTPGHIYWDADSVLTELVRHNIRHLDRVTVIGNGINEGPFDRHLSAVMLPTVVGRLPNFSPWSAPDAGAPRSRTGRARIGVAWASSPYPIDHLERTIPLSVLAPMFWRDDVEIYSLQVGERATDALYYPNVRAAEPPLQSFSDTARWMASMDGVISVDTSVAHLAGQLGIPTLLLLRYAADRRWGLDHSTPWYPSVRLLRQQFPGDWLSVLSQVWDALDAGWPVTG